MKYGMKSVQTHISTRSEFYTVMLHLENVKYMFDYYYFMLC